MAADRLVLVNEGTAKEFSGSLEDYTDLVLGKNQPKREGGGGKGFKKDKKAAAQAREQASVLRKTVKAMEEKIASLTARRSEIDRAMFDPKSATPADANRTMTELMRLRADVESELNAVEAEWLEASEALEGAA
jgi:ATP-binding cassette subfamily F protein 3